MEAQTMLKIKISVLLTLVFLTSCSFPASAPPTPTPMPPEPAALVFITTETPSPIPPVTDTPVFTPTATPIPPVVANVCTDPQTTTLIDSLKKAMLTDDGALLSSLVSSNGMEVRWVRYGTAIKYSAYQAQFLFVTTYQANWGAAPGSGQNKTGAFHDVIVPELKTIFNQTYTLHCNEIRHGGASYEINWPYKKDFYSIYYAGTDINGNLDWHTWVVGIEYVNGKPFIYALMQFFWEP
jgi:hypothetical protein